MATVDFEPQPFFVRNEYIEDSKKRPMDGLGSPHVEIEGYAPIRADGHQLYFPNALGSGCHLLLRGQTEALHAR